MCKHSLPLFLSFGIFFFPHILNAKHSPTVHLRIAACSAFFVYLYLEAGIARNPMERKWVLGSWIKVTAALYHPLRCKVSDQEHGGVLRGDDCTGGYTNNRLTLTPTWKQSELHVLWFLQGLLHHPASPTQVNVSWIMDYLTDRHRTVCQKCLFTWALQWTMLSPVLFILYTLDF